MYYINKKLTNMLKLENKLASKQAYKINIGEQGVYETFSEYLSALRKLSGNCKFGAMKDRVLSMTT